MKKIEERIIEVKELIEAIEQYSKKHKTFLLNRFKSAMFSRIRETSEQYLPNSATTLRELLELDDEDLIMLPGIGKKTLKTLKDFIKEEKERIIKILNN